jgi:UDP:flavonoid glycosyltransferase YjiC (YdhE family)
MTRVLAYTSPARGHLYPIVPTLLELRRRGHDVHVATLASEVEAVEAAGLHGQPIAAAIEQRPLDDWDAPTMEEGIGKVLATFADRATAEIPDLLRLIEDVDPGLLLVDIMSIGAAAVAEASGLPWAQWIPLFQHASFDGTPATALMRVPFALHPAGMDVLNQPRLACGLPPLGGEDVWPAPLNLYMTGPPFEVEALDFPASFNLVGTTSWEPESAPLSWLDDLERPVVLVTPSSEFQPDRAIVETALEALAGQPGTVVASTAAHDPDSFDAPANARVQRWLPHLQLLPHADVVVCHGGMGITQKALAAGVPVCVVPRGRDQFEVAGRVAAAGAGTVVMPDQLSPANLRDAIRQAAGLRAGAQRAAANFAGLGGAASAADALERVQSDPVAATASQVGSPGGQYGTA